MEVKNYTQILARADALATQYATKESREQAAYEGLPDGFYIHGHNGSYAQGSVAGGVAALVVGAALACFIANVQEYRKISLQLRETDQEALSAPLAQGVLLAKKHLLLEVRSDLRESLALKISLMASTIFAVVGGAMRIAGALQGGVAGSALILGVMAYRCAYSSNAKDIEWKVSCVQTEVVSARQRLFPNGVVE